MELVENKMRVAAYEHASNEDSSKLSRKVQSYHSFVEGSKWSVNEICGWIKQNFHSENNGKLHVVVSNDKHITVDDLVKRLEKDIIGE